MSRKRRMSDLPDPDSGASVAEEGDDKVTEKLDPQKVLPHLRCVKCQAFFRDPVYRCENGHTTCFLCCNDEYDITHSILTSDPPCPIEGCSRKTGTHCVGENCSQIVEDLELDVPCKYRENGCGHKGAEDEVLLHEDECGFRKIFSCPLYYLECTDRVQFQHLIDHLKEKHGIEDKMNKWILADKFKDGGNNLYKRAYKFEYGPDGKLFYIDIFFITYSGEQEPDLTLFGSVHVVCGEQEAKKYRAEFRVSCNDTTVSLTHSGPIFPVDHSDHYSDVEEEYFEMSARRFKYFNHGQKYFGDHNKDNNGEYVLPIEHKIIKKELGQTPVDA